MKIEDAVARLERNLPIRRNQLALSAPLRRLHQRILRHYLAFGRAPDAADLGDPPGWREAIDTLAARYIIVLDDAGSIAGAYPFVNEARGFQVITRHGAVNAMCAFDALAVSGMFGLPARIESRCRLSGQTISIDQDDARIRVHEPDEPVYAAIDWQAAAGAANCSATLCLQMMFVIGAARARDWCAASPDRECYELVEARALVAAVFMSLMT